MALIVKQLNAYSCKTYLVKSDSSIDVLLIDPVLEHVLEYVKLIDKEGWNLKYVIDTHTHADHISGCAALQDIKGCSYIMQRIAPALCPNIRIDDNQVLELLPGVSFEFFYTPGHTGDSITIVVENYVFTGDCLFLDDGGAGRDDLPGGDSGAHWESILLYKDLPENLLVHPAHEYRNRQPSTLAQQKKTNPYFQYTSKDQYLRFVAQLKLTPAEWMKDVLKANYACAQNPKAAWIPIDISACEVPGMLASNVNATIVSNISAIELKRRIRAGNEVIMVDVREPSELVGEMAAIKGSINIPILQINSRSKELQKYQDKEIILICRSGHRANTAAQILKKSNFLNVRVLSGGMLNWIHTQ